MGIGIGLGSAYNFELVLKGKWARAKGAWTQQAQSSNRPGPINGPRPKRVQAQTGPGPDGHRRPGPKGPRPRKQLKSYILCCRAGDGKGPGPTGPGLSSSSQAPKGPWRQAKGQGWGPNKRMFLEPWEGHTWHLLTICCARSSSIFHLEP